MKIKSFCHYTDGKQSLEDFEKEINDFMATVEVVDVKYSVSTDKDTGWTVVVDNVLVLYK